MNAVYERWLAEVEAIFATPKWAAPNPALRLPDVRPDFVWVREPDMCRVCLRSFDPVCVMLQCAGCGRCVREDQA